MSSDLQASSAVSDAPILGGVPGSKLQNATVRLVVAHPEDLVCRSIESVLGAEDDLEVAGTLSDHQDLVNKVRDLQPDVVVCAATTAGFRDALNRLREASPDVPVLVIASGHDRDQAYEALADGAQGLIETSAPPMRIRAAALAVASGLAVLPRDVYRRSVVSTADARARVSTLPEDQRLVLRRVAEGATIAEIAQEVFVSERTIKRRIADLRRRLDCDSRAELVAVYSQATLTEDAAARQN